MQMKWRQRIIKQPSLADHNQWPIIDPITLPRKRRAAFIRNKSIVVKILAGESQDEVAKYHRIDPTLVTKLMDRCLGGSEDDPPALTAGLIPHHRLRQSVRNKELSSLHKNAGARCSFSYLLENVPLLKETLDNMIYVHVKRKSNGQNLTPKVFHAAFIRLLREAQWPQDRYPFTEPSLGYESTRRYLRDKVDELMINPRQTSRAIRLITTETSVYDEIIIDEHLYDATGRIDLVLDDQRIPLRLGRISVALAIDKDSDCRLASKLCLTRHPNQEDILSLLAQLHSWTPLKLSTPMLQYAPGACFPAALGHPFSHAGPGIIRLDNALVHIAHSVRDYICREMGATLNLGLPGQPKARNVVEHAFDLLGDLARRYPSTTGSHPKDSLKESRQNSKRPQCASLRALEEVISVINTQHNITAQARLGGRSPLEVLRDRAEKGWIRMLPDQIAAQLNPFRFRRLVPLHLYKHEKRAPFINFETLRYQGPGLRDASLLKTGIYIEGDRRDIRLLQGFRITGEPLGELMAPKSWQRHTLSMETRRHIAKITKKERLSIPDPLGGYFAYLLEHKELPSTALEMVRVYRELDTADVTVPKEKAPNPIFLNDKTPGKFSWSPKLARR